MEDYKPSEIFSDRKTRKNCSYCNDGEGSGKLADLDDYLESIAEDPLKFCPVCGKKLDKSKVKIKEWEWLICYEKTETSVSETEEICKVNSLKDANVILYALGYMHPKTKFYLRIVE